VGAANATLERTGDEEQAIFACIAAAGKESEMETKTFHGAMSLKTDGEPGQFEAKFATLNVVDKDGDVTLPGAFTDGEPVRISAWAHGWDKLPVGRGEIHERDGAAIVDGKFFLNTQIGREHYETVKALGDLQEWSYGFEVVEAEPGTFDGREVRFLKRLKVHEVSPVMRGAGVDTRTVAIKAVKAAFPSHSTATTDAAWDGPANEARVRSGESAGYYARIYAWHDPDGDEGVKSTYRFIHHMVGQGGEPGAANIRACQTGIAVLNGARGGTTIPEADRRGVYNHLAAHLRSANVEPPDLKAHADYDWQEIHDMAVQLGAKCAGHTDEHDAERDSQGQASGRAEELSPSTVAARIAIELIEMGFGPKGEPK